MPAADTDAAPALAGTASGQLLLVAWKGAASNRVDYKINASGAGWSEPQTQPQARTDRTPALAINGSGTLHALWKEPGDSRIDGALTTAP